MTTERSHRIVVAGLGNLLLCDDGVGIHALRELAKDPPAGVELADAGTAILHAIEMVAGADCVLAIDAVRAGGAPGTVYCFDGGDAAECGRCASVHSMGLKSALHFLPAEERPLHLTVLGVEPERVEYGMEMSAAVQAALPRVVAEARRMLNEWTNGLLTGVEA